MQLVAWNVRGMNKVHKQKEAKLFIRTNNVSIIALLEHTINDHQTTKVLKAIAPGWIGIDNYICSNQGIKWILWDPQVIECEPLIIDEQFIHSKVRIKSLNSKFLFSAICGLHTIEARRNL